MDKTWDATGKIRLKSDFLLNHMIQACVPFSLNKTALKTVFVIYSTLTEHFDVLRFQGCRDNKVRGPSLKDLVSDQVGAAGIYTNNYSRIQAAQ